MKHSGLFVSAFAAVCVLTGYLLSAPASAAVRIEKLTLSAEKSASVELIRELSTPWGRMVTSGNFPSMITSGNFPNMVTSGNFPDMITSGNFPTNAISELGAPSSALPAPRVAL